MTLMDKVIVGEGVTIVLRDGFMSDADQNIDVNVTLVNSILRFVQNIKLNYEAPKLHFLIK